MKYWKYLTHMNVCLLSLCLLSGCGNGGANDGSSSDVQNASRQSVSKQPTESLVPVETTTDESKQITPAIPAESNTTVLSGTITYDRVLFDGRYYKGLNYSTIEALPIRGVTVQVLNGNNSIIHSTQSNDLGEYSFDVTTNTNIRIRVLAELSGSGSASWNIKIKDNTNGNALYVLDGSLANTGDNETQTRNLHAASGWSGDSYQNARSASPFAALDSIYDSVQLVINASPNMVLPPLSVYWSERNIAINGNLSDGYIGTSFFTGAGPSIYLLGTANNDSDEFDRAVVQHEFGHYIEHELSRTESIGGSHSPSSHLDLRVAFGEAWGNVFAGMTSGDPIYRDSLGHGQALGFSINVQNRSYGKQGWFSEGSIQNILYNLFDDQNEGADTLSFGFKPIFDVLTSPQYLDFDGFASIYPFIEILKQQQPDKTAQIDQLVKSFNINGSGLYGDNETNNGGSSVTLPIYQKLTLGQTINVCSDSNYQNYNGFDIYRYIRVSLPRSGNYNISAVKTSGGLSRSNPQIRIYQQGSSVAFLNSSLSNNESNTRWLASGNYIFEVYEQSNTDGDNNTGGLACFNITVN